MTKPITSWPQLISKVLVTHIYNAASDWPHTSLTPRVFLFSIPYDRKLLRE